MSTTIFASNRKGKRAATISLLLVVLNSTAQCDSISGFVKWSNANPSFIGLYNNDYCLSDSLSDTTLYFNFAPEYLSGFFNWGFSSPNGHNLTVTNVTVYDSACNIIAPDLYFPNQPPTNDTLIVSFTLRTTFIDNFCPYYVPFTGLSIELGEITVTQIGNDLFCNWQTYSETNSNYIIVQLSSDAINYYDVANAKAAGNSSLARSYSVGFVSPFYKTVYLRLCEVDLDGLKSYSEPVVFYYVPDFIISVNRLGNYDYSGRLLR